MEPEFWNSLLTEKSWKILQDIRKKYNFILIGGWAVYLLTRNQKSKDIDIVIGIKELEKFRDLGLRKNERLKKYEVKIEEIDIDIYVEYYSRLAIPVEGIKEYTTNIEGFKIAKPELLLILKQGAYRDRSQSIKGEKDKIDILSLLFSYELDFKKYAEIVKKHKIKFFGDELKRTVAEFKDYSLLSLTPRAFKLKKGKILKEIRKSL